MVPKDASGFSVRLQRGNDVEHADIHFNLSASFGHSPMVVFNARRSGVWGVEEPCGALSFPVSSPFLLVLTAALDCFEVEITGAANESCKSRDGLPVSSVTHLAVEGSISLRTIHIPVENMPRNLRLSIPGKAKVGDMVFLRGAPSPEAQSFVMNIQSGPGKLDDVMFHFNPRVPEKEVILNSRMDDEWGTPEKPTVPFDVSGSFDLVFATSSLGFDTWLDGKEFSNFNHRHDVANATTLFIEGDVCCENIVIDCPPCSLPQEWDDGLKLSSRTPRLQAFCPEIPVISRITGGLDKCCVLLLSGVVPKEPTGFQLNLQCDSCDDSDIALQYSHRWEGSSKEPLLSLNSREDEKWGSEVRIKDDKLILAPGMHFDVAILFTGENFRLSANGLHQGDFPMRLDGVRVDYVTVSGDVVVHRLLVL